MKHAVVVVALIASMVTMATAQKKAGTITRQIQPAGVQRGSATAPARPAGISGITGKLVPSRFEEVRAEDKMPVYWDDVLVTGRGGRMRATLDDGSILNVGPASQLTVKRMDSRAQQAQFELHYGKVRAQVVRLTQPDSKFDIRTNTAIVTALEGGDIYVDASSPTNTVVTCISGKVDVWGTDIAIPELNNHVVLSAGERTAYGSGGKLQERSATAEELRMAADETGAERPASAPLETVLLKAEDNVGAAPPPKTGGPFGAGAFRIGGGVSAPQLTYRVEPEYSEEARKARIQGTVVLYAVVDPDGMVRQVRVIRSLDPVLDENAMKAVRQWRFKPGTKDGRPVPVVASIEVTFRFLDHPDIGQKKP